MAIHMAQTIKEERLRWVKPIVEGTVKVCPHSTRSLERWLKAYKQSGEAALEPKSTRPKTHPDETPIRIKERILELRKETSKCALKLKWDMEKEGIEIHHRTIGKILKKEGVTRKYKMRRIQNKYVRVLLKPGELIEIDVKYVPKKIAGKRYFQYTAIDVAGRWRYLQAFDDQTTHNSIEFLKEVMRRAPWIIGSIKTDNHSTFTNRAVGYPKSIDPKNIRLHPLDEFCEQHNIIHYLIDAGKPQQNGTIERSHRSDQETFYDRNDFISFEHLQFRMRLWNMYYNDLAHCSLNGKSPNQFLINYKLTNPPYLCT